MCESTNVERAGYTMSERVVGDMFKDAFRDAAGRVFVTTFASHIERIQQVLTAAEATGRHVAVVGRSMENNVRLALSLGYLSARAGTIVELDALDDMAPREIVIITTGSQGEPMAALTRLAFGKHKDFTVEEGDAVVISARVIPGNEGRVSRLVNHFCRHGARVYDESEWMIHVSGHASQEELKLMLNLTRPRFFIPVHGEFRQLYAHKLLAEEVGIPRERIILAETGDIIVLTREEARIEGKAPVGRRLIDEGGIAEVDEIVVRDRQQLSLEGVVLAVVAINKSTGRLEGAPELVSRGHVQEEEAAAFMAEARQVIIHALEECTDEERTDSIVLSELVRTELKRFFRKRTGTRPMIVPVVMSV